jgi:hypothetical protein
LLGPANLQIQVLTLLADGERDQAVRRTGTGTLQSHEQLCLQAPFVAVKHVPVRRVHNDRNTGPARRNPAEDSSLGRMRMQHVRSLPVDQARQLPEGEQITSG